MICIPQNNIGVDMPDVWYRGEVELTDNIWQIDLMSQTATVLSNPLLETGRALDVYKVIVGRAGDVYFVNKNDQTLWLLNNREG